MPTPKGRLRLAAANRPAPMQEPPHASPRSGSAQPSQPTIEDAFRRYAPLVASVALRLSGDASETDDVVQEVFLRATGGIKGLRKHAAIKAWLMSITINVLRHRLRQRRLRQFVGLDQPTEYGELV